MPAPLGLTAAPEPQRRTLPSPAAAVRGLRGWWASDSDRSVAQRIAGAAFLIRAVSAGAVYGSQVVLARWMGSHEFGIYIYVAAWLMLIGELAPLGLSTVAQRFIPEYRTIGAMASLRGFLTASRWITFATGTVLGLACAGLVLACRDLLDPIYLVPLVLVCVALPFHGLSQMLDGTAGTFGWIRLALVPPYLLKPALIFGFVALAHALGIAPNATNAMLAAVAATWIAAMVQLVLVQRALPTVVGPGPRSLHLRTWLETSLPVMLLRALYVLLATTDVIVLQFFRDPREIGLFYAAAKVMALVSFVSYAVARGVDYKFAEYQAAGDRVALTAFLSHSVRLTFWPSLAATVTILALGQPLLWLYGPDFTAAYPLMFLLAIGLLARAAVGPAERLLITLGQQRACALVYAAAFAICLAGCLILIPPFGTIGAAVATSSAMLVESALLVWAVRARLGFRIFVLGA
jgi:O-antigen/teichoic acid export membrane protein